MKGSPTERLLAALESLPSERATLLVEFAEFLASRAGAPAPERLSGPPEADSAPSTVASPLDVPRPAVESVVAAIRRLRMTYPMLDSRPMLDQVTTLMTQHVMQGRAAVDAIDDLEALFLRFYEELRGR